MSTPANARRFLLLVPIVFALAALFGALPAGAAEPVGEMTPVSQAASSIGTPQPIFLSGCLVGTLCCLEEWQVEGICQPWERLARCCDSSCGNCHGKAFCHNLDPDPCQT